MNFLVKIGPCLTSFQPFELLNWDKDNLTMTQNMNRDGNRASQAKPVS